MIEEKQVKTKKKPLSLGVALSVDDVKKLSEEKIKRNRGVVVEKIGQKNTPSKDEPEEKEEKIVENQEKAPHSLTEEEINRRINALSSLDELKKKKEEENKQRIKIEDINEEILLEASINKNTIDTPKHQSTKSEKSKSNKEFLDIEETVKEKKSKKSLTEQEETNNKNWKNFYTQDIEENDIEEDFEEDFEEAENREEQKKASAFAYQAKRKNKRRDSSNYNKIYHTVVIENEISLRDLALNISEKVETLVKTLNKLGINVNKNSILDVDTAEIVTVELGHKVKRSTAHAIEEQYTVFNDKEEDLSPRVPVVTIMGHVDHGKTTLLDTMRKSNVADKESGGITQHIGAYQVKTKEGKVITFLDTPGHEAFSQIRQRGSSVTDIVVLVVAANDGIKPQTIEALNHAKVAKVPIIVAINKIDLPDNNPQKVKTDLLQHDIVVEDMGGDVLCVEISAKSNLNIDKLLELIVLQAEILDLKTNNKALGVATIIEVKKEKGFGVLATLLVQRGTLKVGDICVCGSYSFKIKTMIDYQGNRIKIALPSTPIEVSGFDEIPNAGDLCYVVESDLKAKELIKFREENSQKIKNTTSTKDLIDFFSQQVVTKKVLNVIIKADTQGSIDAIKGSLEKIISDQIEIKFTNLGVGEINESDINLALNSGAIVIGFNSRANNKAKELAKNQDVEIRYHSIIYNLIDDIKLILSGLLDPDIVENIIGYAEVREVFNISKQGKIAGCFVKEGILKRSALVRVLRDNVVIHEGQLSQLKRFKEDVKEVKTNFECGVSIENYNDIQVNDLIECFETVEVKQSIE